MHTFIPVAEVNGTDDGTAKHLNTSQMDGLSVIHGGDQVVDVSSALPVQLVPSYCCKCILGINYKLHTFVLIKEAVHSFAVFVRITPKWPNIPYFATKLLRNNYS